MCDHSHGFIYFILAIALAMPLHFSGIGSVKQRVWSPEVCQVPGELDLCTYGARGAERRSGGEFYSQSSDRESSETRVF